MPNVPSEAIQRAFLEPTSRIIRRIEIYESDGVKPWKPHLWENILVSGSVNVNYGDTERRTFDCTLNNSDGELKPVAGGLWYDKVFKVFYGIRLDKMRREPRVMIVEELDSPGQALALKSLLNRAGIKTVHYNPRADLYSEIEDFDVIVSISSTTTAKVSLLTEAYLRGKGVITFAPYGSSTLTASVSGVVNSTGGMAVSSNSDTHQVMQGFEPWRMNPVQPYKKIISLHQGVQTLVFMSDDNNGLSPGVVYVRSPSVGNAWIHSQQARFKVTDFEDSDMEYVQNASDFYGKVMTYLHNYTDVDYWETQIGEFLSDSIEDADSVSDLIKVSGRDYTKRCIKSKFSKPTTFTAAMTIEEIIRSVASNAGVTKFDFPVTGKTLGKDQTWERDTERWQVMIDIASANNYELYFTGDGFLTMREFRDPVTTAPALVLTTGLGGNLVSRRAKTGDGELFNHVTVVGESSDSKTPLVFGEARNDDPASPTWIGIPGQPGGIGDRVKNISSAVVTTSQQAQELANATLAVSQLEEFELPFESVFLPWVEPGDIIEMGESDDKYWGPSRYLLSSLSLPLDLGPMSGTGKRVTKVV